MKPSKIVLAIIAELSLIFLAFFPKNLEKFLPKTTEPNFRTVCKVAAIVFPIWFLLNQPEVLEFLIKSYLNCKAKLKF